MMKRPCGVALILLISTVLCSLQPVAAVAIASPLEEESRMTPKREGLASLSTTAPATISSATTVDEWLTQIAQAELVEITNVQVEETDAGVTLRLETIGELTSPEISVTGNAAIADIPNALLNLPDSDDFFASDPAEGIALIDIANLSDNRVRIAITGIDAPPAVNITTGSGGLTLSVAPGDPTAQVSDNETIQVVVTGEQESYVVPNASTATRTDTPILDTPASIQVIPRQVLDDQQVIRIEDALTNLSGVTFAGTFAGLDVDFNIRGFNGAPIFRDGFRQFGFGNDGIPELANLEQIEVLRGPASILYGEIQPGGIINLVTEQPLAEPFYEAQVQVGNRGFVSPSIDFSGPLTDDGRVRYRLNALFRQENSFRDFDTKVTRSFFAPIVSWDIGDRTDLTVQLDYSDYEGIFETGLPAIGNEVADVPASLNTGELDDFVEIESINVGYNLEHRFSNNWRLRNAFRFTRQDILDVGALPLFFLDESAGIISRGLSRQVRDPQDFGLQTNVVGEFATGPVDHTLLFGIDLNRSEERDTAQFSDFADFQPLNIFDPVYGTFDGVDPETLPIFRDEELTRDRLGIYLQDQLTIFDNLIVLAGVRYDTVEQTITALPDAFDPTTRETEQNDDAWIPRVGIVYQPIPNVSLYGSYSQSFTPNSGTTTSGDPLEPERGEGFEAGVKAEFLDGDFLATLAYFDITRQNVATADPVDPFASVATGEQRSRGVELDLTGEILPGWNILASYAYIDAEVTEDNVIPEGNRVFNAPKNSASLWTTYEFQHGDFEGLGFGVGFNFVGDRAGDLANSFDVDSYVLTNAALFYRRDNWRLAVNARNIFDIDFIEATQNSRTNLNEPGDPFTIIGSVSVQF
ncbi:MAG: TonB-dependent siderophore receptor [Cyanobacteria bacterium P01_E01_bin.6]